MKTYTVELSSEEIENMEYWFGAWDAAYGTDVEDCELIKKLRELKLTKLERVLK